MIMPSWYMVKIRRGYPYCVMRFVHSWHSLRPQFTSHVRIYCRTELESCYHKESETAYQAKRLLPKLFEIFFVVDHKIHFAMCYPTTFLSSRGNSPSHYLLDGSQMNGILLPRDKVADVHSCYFPDLFFFGNWFFFIENRLNSGIQSHFGCIVSFICRAQILISHPILHKSNNRVWTSSILGG